jgi:uncharacterized protein (DUF1810 family)
VAAPRRRPSVRSISGPGEALGWVSGLLLAVTGRTPEEILGPVDATKVRSSMTLFQRVAPEEPPFKQVLDRYNCGLKDEATDALLM